MNDKFCDNHMQLEKTLVKVMSDVEHIKGRMDNGMSTSIAKILDRVNEIAPIVRDHAYWIDKVKQGFFWLTVIAIGGGLAAITFAVVRKFILKI